MHRGAAGRLYKASASPSPSPHILLESWLSSAFSSEISKLEEKKTGSLRERIIISKSRKLQRSTGTLNAAPIAFTGEFGVAFGPSADVALSATTLDENALLLHLVLEKAWSCSHHAATFILVAHSKVAVTLRTLQPRSPPFSS
jgi:hypothetical protein